MSGEVAAAYDGAAERYAALFLRDLVDDEDARPWVSEFVAAVDVDGGMVADVGCGPGHGVAHLAELGLRVFGVDLSEGQIRQARSAFPDIDVRVGDLTALDLDDASLSGVFARYSIIHIDPRRLADVFVEWARVLQPGAPVLLFFFASLHQDDHGTRFDHQVATAYELDPGVIGAELAGVGFTAIRTAAAPPSAGGRPLGKGVVFARRGER